MAKDYQGKIGPIVAADGSAVDPRLTRDGGTTVGDLHGRYYESSSRGSAFIATTASAGIAHGSALTATPALALANPAGSGFNIAINKLIFGAVSGTLGVGQLWWTVGVNPNSLPAETTAAVRNSTLLNATNGGDIAKAYSGVSLTNVPVIVRPTVIGYEGLVVATTETAFLAPQFEEVAGELVVPPGYFVAVEGIGTAGTTPLVVLALSYEIVRP